MLMSIWSHYLLQDDLSCYFHNPSRTACRFGGHYEQEESRYYTRMLLSYLGPFQVDYWRFKSSRNTPPYCSLCLCLFKLLSCKAIRNFAFQGETSRRIKTKQKWDDIIMSEAITSRDNWHLRPRKTNISGYGMDHSSILLHFSNLIDTRNTGTYWPQICSFFILLWSKCTNWQILAKFTFSDVILLRVLYYHIISTVCLLLSLYFINYYHYHIIFLISTIWHCG